ncbi:MAG: cytochrome c oxidase accessory protein CcoG [Rhodospirillales bacterium]|nr:cytochrome c oxidase accessory protein CcoG [Rhodospirillales bacterium]USO07855.1 MAG: cytochrome c oxidase accessory protein CcoG [Rhodospirillales bacterium]
MLESFAKQQKVYPKSIWGRFRRLKWAVLALLLGLYYLAPFVRWDRGPNAPGQAILIDMPHRRAYWFWIEIWPQEVYILTGILIVSAVALFFVTSLFGRVWCGYLCPQTVWTDLYIWVEKQIQGDRNARMRLQEGPWTFERIFKTGLTHLIWLLIALMTGGAFVLYFTDAPTLVQNMLHFDVSTTTLGFILGLTFSTYLMAGFAREQVCTYMCPYARFQSAMFDKDTLIIGYDAKRGEPRGSFKKGASWEGRGHCIDCTQCVQVCPMGIDIRNGLQMECIACGLCIDACDNIMDKMNLPRGLIRYDTQHSMDTAAATGQPAKGFHLWRMRTLYYTLILAVVCGLILSALVLRSPLDLHVLHDRNPRFVQLSSGEIRNGYEIKILNKTHADRVYSIGVSGLENAQISVNATEGAGADHLNVPADSVGNFRVSVSSDVKPGPARKITFHLEDQTHTLQIDKDSMFVSERE